MAALILVRDGNIEGLKGLLAVDKTTIDAVDEDGNTALMIASWSGKDECVDVLIQAGAMLDVANKQKFTALMLACRDGHGASAKALLDAGARVDIVSNIGYTALDYTEQQGHGHIKRMLDAAIKLKKKQSQETIPETIFIGGSLASTSSSCSSSKPIISSTPSAPITTTGVTSFLPASVSLNGKVAIVTGCGSSTGIGFAIAAHLLELQAAVMITSTTDRINDRASELKKMFSSGNVSCSYGDLTTDAYCRELVDRTISSFGHVDILVNNAGMTSVGLTKGPDESGDVLTLTHSGWNNSLTRNLDTMFLMTKQVLPQMKLRPPGTCRIINIASTTGPVNATTGDVGYATAKAGMTGFTRAVALDTASFGITCNAIAPGWICTGSQGESEAKQGLRCPLRRSGTPHEIASCVGYLASSGSSYLTGQVLVIDGGNSVDEARI